MNFIKISKIIFLVGLTVPLGHSAAVEGRNNGNKIVGGNVPRPHQYPSIVDIRKKRDSNSSHYCGGSILSENWIITAAHCSFHSPFSYEIVAGEHNIKVVEGTEQRRSVIQIIRHEKYDASTIENDIALMRVSSPLVLNKYVGVVKLPPKGYTVDGNTVAIGWGKLTPNGASPDTLQHVVVPFVRDSMCQEAYHSRRIYDSMMCAGHPEGGKGTCQGDSGGPLNHNGTLVGLTSWSRSCALKGFPGVYTEVSYYIDWIKNAMGSN